MVEVPARLQRAQLLTRGRHEAVVRAFKGGSSPAEAAAAAGVSHRTLLAWMGAGQLQSHGAYRELFDAVSLVGARRVGALGSAGIRVIRVPRFYRPHRAQARFHLAARLARICAACAGRRGGKTQAGAAEVASRAYADLADKLAGRGLWEGEPHHPWKPAPGRDPEPFLRYAIVAPTYALLDEPRIALRRELGLVEDGGLIVFQSDHVWWLVGGIRLDFLSGDVPARLVSHGYNGVWFEEGARLKRDVWVENMRPTLSNTGGWAVWTTTPLGKNWFWEEVWCKGNLVAATELAALRGEPVEAILDAEYACVTWTTADNTRVPRLAAEMEIARRQLPTAQFIRNYRAGFDAFEGQCFDLLEAEHFTGAGVPRHGRGAMTMGVDLGQTHRTSMTLVVLWAGEVHELHTESGSDVDYYGDDAWARREEGDRSTWANRAWAALVAEAGREGWRAVKVFLPADRPDVKRIWLRYGFKVRDAYQSHAPAVDWVATAVHNRKVKVRSAVLWRGLVGLRYPARGEHSTKLWIDEGDDEWDGFRYALSDVISTGTLPTPSRLTALARRR